MVGDDDVFPPDNRRNGWSGRQIDVFDSLPTTRELRLSPSATASMASAAPLLNEWILTMLPRLMCVSRAPIVICCGDTAMSMEPDSTRST